VQVRVDAGGPGVGVLAWTAPPDVTADELAAALREAGDAALAADGVRRLEATVPADDRLLRRAVLRAGFRLEGVRRAVLPTAAGPADVALFGRLVDDRVGGQHGFSAVMNSVLPRTRLIAHVVIRAAGDRVLLCETVFKPDWELPGGIVERGEPPRLAAERELLEELGVPRPVGRLLVADWMPPYLGWDDAMELLFDGGTIDDAELVDLVLQPSEIAQVRLCTLAEAEPLLTPLAHRRLSVALSLGPEEFAYLEDGFRPDR
jgi:8-oxo-dGTP diphosphatase